MDLNLQPLLLDTTRIWIGLDALWERIKSNNKKKNSFSYIVNTELHSVTAKQLVNGYGGRVNRGPHCP